MNPIQMLIQSQNPQQLILQLLQQNMGNTPIGKNLLTMAQSNNQQGIEQLARNICASQGKNFDQEFNSFKKTLGIK